MQAEETVDQYADFILKQSRQLQLSDSEILQIFIQGLRSDIKQFFLLNQPEDMAQALQSARLKFMAVASTSDDTVAALQDIQPTINRIDTKNDQET